MHPTLPVTLHAAQTKCRKTSPCIRSFSSSLAHWTAGGGAGRNHLVLMASCVHRCDFAGEYPAFGSSGEAMFASPSTWFGLFRRGFDLFLAQGFTKVMHELARDAPADGWWAEPSRAHSGSLRVGRRPLLLTFRGSITGTNHWTTARLLANEWAHDAASGVFISVADKLSVRAGCGTRAHADWQKEATEAGAPAATLAVLRSNFSSLLSSSAFGFAPGGSGPYSHRFGEVLAAGSIPVVPEDLVMPWDGAVRRPIEWDACVVRVNAAEVRALGEVVSAVAPAGSAALAARRLACGRAWAQLEGPRRARFVRWFW